MCTDLETGRGGGFISPKVRGGVGDISEFSGAPGNSEILQGFSGKSSIWESKVQLFKGQLSRRVPPPLAFRAVPHPSPTL